MIYFKIGESMEPYFINEAFDKAINDYMSSKDKKEGILYNSFLVVVIRILINIYGELDIINPYQIKSKEALKNNIMKFGAKSEDVEKLFELISNFYLIERRNSLAIKREENIYFISVQKVLIDLFTLKRLNFGLNENESKEFFDLLYTPGTSNILRQSYNYLNASNIYEIAEYYQNKMLEKPKEEKEEEKKLLKFDIYKLFNVSIADISKMNAEDVDKLNKEIYKSFDISENAINKDYLLEEKLKEIKMQNSPITTGNGYVDILLIMSVIVTTIMVVVIFSTIVF